MEDLDLRARLKVTDESGDALKRAAGDLKGVAGEADHANQQMGFVGHTLANFAAVELSGVIHGAREMAAEFVHAASAGQQADLAVAGLIATAQGREWADSTQEAQKLGDELDEIGLSAHRTGSDVAAAFQSILEITGATEEGVEKATDQVEQMAHVAQVLGKDTQSIAQEFAMMGEGIVRTKGQLFQLIKGTGIFGDDVKKASAAWAQLTEEERGKRLGYALDQMSNKMRTAAPTFADMLTTMHGIWEVTQEKLGEPLINALVPEMTRFADELRAGLPAIEEFGKEMSVDVAKWVHDAADAVQEGFAYLKDHGKEIHDSIVTAVDAVKAVVDFILTHKEALAIAFGGNAALKLAGGLAGAVSQSTVGGAIGKGVGAVYSAGAAGGGWAGTAGAAAGVTALGAVTAAGGAWLLAGSQLGKLFAEMSDDTRDKFNAIEDGMARMADQSTEWTDVEVDSFERMRQNLLLSAQAFGEDAGAANRFAEALASQHKAHAANMEYAESVAAMAKSFEVVATANALGVEYAKDAAERAAAEKEQEAFDSGQGASAVQSVADGFAALVAAGDQGAQMFVARQLATSKNMFGSFLATAQMTDEGFLALAESLEKGGTQFTEQAKAVRDLITKHGEAPKMNMHFSMPGAKIDIQQDFRDQDPDRIALVFKDELMRSSINRLGSGFSTPHGA